MKGIRQAVVAIALTGGLVSAAEARVFVGVDVGLPAAPVYVAPAPVYYAPPPPPPPVYAPVVVGYYGHPNWHPYWHPYWHPHYYGYGYWRR